MASTYYNLQGHDIFVGLPNELNLKFNPEDSSDTVFAFDGDGCNISFVVEPKRCTQEEISDATKEGVKSIQMDTNTAETVGFQSVNGSGSMIIGTNQQNSELNVMTGTVCSLFTEQTLFVLASFSCDIALIGNIMGSVAFKSANNFHSFGDYDVLVRFPDELQLKLDEEASDANTACFIGDGTECVMSFTVANEKYSEEDIVSECNDYLAKVNVRKSTVSRSDCDTVNGKAQIMTGLRDDDSGANLLISFVTSNVTEQTVVIMCTFGCDPLLVGQAIGATTFIK